MVLRPLTSTRTSIVIPHYNQSGYLPEALAVATAQHATVVVVDDASGREHRAAAQQAARQPYGGRVTLLQRPYNGGLSAARNCGIEWVLREHPATEFILPLDADDLIVGGAIERLEARFDEIDDDSVGWLYGDAVLFGTFESMARMPSRFTRYRLSQQNLCFSTSFLRRSMFDAGLRYDEALLDGFEDWEFYLHATELGFHGMHVGDLGFHYRKHGSSMLTSSRLTIEETRRRIEVRHPDMFDRDRQAALEHADLPRFAVVDLDDGAVTYLSSPDLEPHLVEDPTADLGGYRPPVVVLVRSDWLAEVRHLRLWHQTLAVIQESMRHQSYVLLGWHGDEDPHVRGLHHGPGAATLSGIAVDATRVRLGTARILDLLTAPSRSGPRAAPVLGPIVGHPPPTAPLELDDALRATVSALLAPEMAPARFSSRDEVAPSDRQFAASHTIGERRVVGTRVDRPGERSIGVVLPWVGLGGMDMIMLALAEVLSRRPQNRLHLMTTERGRMEISRSFAASFTTINPVPDAPGAEHTVRAFMEDMDVLLIANSRTAFHYLPAVSARTAPSTFVFIQNVDRAVDDVSVGYLYPLARQHSGAISGFVVPSQLTADQIAGFGVPDHKILVVPNAPIYPHGGDEAELVARTAGFRAGRPLRILYAGRFDRQKGMDRVFRVLQQLDASGVAFEARLVGRAELEEYSPPHLDNVTVVPPTFDATEMTDHFSWADCLILPSRWEGLPLVMLEAMAHGLLVVTTDVGGIPEYVEDGRECVLVEDRRGDDHVVGRFVAALTRFQRAPHTFDAVRHRGRDWASTLRWEEIAASIEQSYPAALASGARA